MAASAPAADDITPRLVMDSTSPPYTMLLIMSNPLIPPVDVPSFTRIPVSAETVTPSTL